MAAVTAAVDESSRTAEETYLSQQAERHTGDDTLEGESVSPTTPENHPDFVGSTHVTFALTILRGVGSVFSDSRVEFHHGVPGQDRPKAISTIMAAFDFKHDQLPAPVPSRTTRGSVGFLIKHL